MQVRNFSPDDFPSGQNRSHFFLHNGAWILLMLFRSHSFLSVFSDMWLVCFVLIQRLKPYNCFIFLFGVVCVHKVTAPSRKQMPCVNQLISHWSEILPGRRKWPGKNTNPRTEASRGLKIKTGPNQTCYESSVYFCPELVQKKEKSKPRARPDPGHPQITHWEPLIISGVSHVV